MTKAELVEAILEDMKFHNHTKFELKSDRAWLKRQNKATLTEIYKYRRFHTKKHYGV